MAVHQDIIDKTHNDSTWKWCVRSGRFADAIRVLQFGEFINMEDAKDTVEAYNNQYKKNIDNG